MKTLTNRELEALFIESVQDMGDDEVEIFGVKYSKIDMLRDADPTHFRIAMNDYIDTLVEDEILFEVEGGYSEEDPNEVEAA